MGFVCQKEGLFVKVSVYTCKSEKVVSYHVDLLSTVICDAVTYILCMFVTPGLEKLSALDYEA